MTASNRPPGFKREPPPKPLALFFGKDDYVVATSAQDAARLWMAHFCALCDARDFDRLPDDEPVEIYIEPERHIGVTDLAYVIEMRGYGLTMSTQTKPAIYWVARFGAGYLASTTEDD